MVKRQAERRSKIRERQTKAKQREKQLEPNQSQLLDFFSSISRLKTNIFTFIHITQLSRKPPAFCEAHYETYANGGQTSEHVNDHKAQAHHSEDRVTLTTPGERFREDEWEYISFEQLGQ